MIDAFRITTSPVPVWRSIGITGNADYVLMLQAHTRRQLFAQTLQSCMHELRELRLT